MTTPAIIHFVGKTQRGRSDYRGPSAIEYIVETANTVEKGTEFIGEAEEPEAEYHALIRGLELASEKGCTEVEARGNSQLVVNQVTGDWLFEEPHLGKLCLRVRELSEEFETFEIVYIERGDDWKGNKLAEESSTSEWGPTLG
jgi:ribonuclease HI